MDNTITVNGDKITVYEHLNSRDALDLLQIAAEAAKESEGVYNPVLLDSYFKTYFVMLITDIKFTEKEKEDILDLYDKLYKDGIINAVLDAAARQYNTILQARDVYITARVKKELSFSGVVDNFINTMPEKAKEVEDILNGINPEAVDRAQTLLDNMNKLGMNNSAQSAVKKDINK